MAKYCCKCMKKIDIFSAAYPIGDQLFCSECANSIPQISNTTDNCQNVQKDSEEGDVFYSGLVVKDGIQINSIRGETLTKEEIKNNFEKINHLPGDIKSKILKGPQFKIFFIKNIPYYTTLNDSVKKELPKVNGMDSYYDPVKDTEAYKLVIDGVKKIADKKYEEEMVKAFGTKHVFGGVHTYYAIEAELLYEIYGIRCINNPMDLNHGLFID